MYLFLTTIQQINIMNIINDNTFNLHNSLLNNINRYMCCLATRIRMQITIIIIVSISIQQSIKISPSNGTTNSNTQIHNTLTNSRWYKYSSDSVVQVRTFINFLTSEFGSSTRGESDTNVKSLSQSFYTNKTNKCLVGPHKHAAHPVVFKIFVGRYLLNSMVRHQLLNTMVLTQLQLSTWPKSTTNSNGPHSTTNWICPQ